MDDIKKRLKETSENCMKALDAWVVSKKDHKARDSLRETIHELRKVASRLEIELALSERDDMAQKPIPIPPHRDAKKRGESKKGEHNDNANNNNNGDNGHGNKAHDVKKSLKPRRRRSHKKAGGGEE